MAAQVDPIPPQAYPELGQCPNDAPTMPTRWSAVVLLQPFSPPQGGDQQPDSPFYQLCLANLSCVEGEYFSAQITGTEYGTWWYTISPQLGTQLSTDQGLSWTPVELGWQLPVNGWFGNTPPTCAGTSPLNWMQAQTAEWWKIPVALPSGPPAATWMWFDTQRRNPVRMMYGQGPPLPTQGDPNQLPLLQMYAFTYFSYFIDYVDVLLPPAPWQQPAIEGLAVGNPQGYANFVFNSSFGMTALMTPVNEAYNPLPTRVLYVWKPDAEYAVATDRAQSTLMLNTYNPGLPTQAPMASQEALLTGRAPAGISPPMGSDTSFLITNNADGTQSCAGPPAFDFPQEAPNWVSIPGVQATIRATITNNPVLCPDTTILIYSVLFPPSAPNYPNSTYLWTWYAPLTPDGKLSRPVTFMQAQSGVGVGTSLALADYFAFELLSEPIDPANFAVPAVCPLPTAQQAVASSPIAAI